MPKISTSSIIRENIRHGFLDPRKLQLLWTCILKRLHRISKTEIYKSTKHYFEAMAKKITITQFSPFFAIFPILPFLPFLPYLPFFREPLLRTISPSKRNRIDRVRMGWKSDRIWGQSHLHLWSRKKIPRWFRSNQCWSHLQTWIHLGPACMGAMYWE